MAIHDELISDRAAALVGARILRDWLSQHAFGGVEKIDGEVKNAVDEIIQKLQANDLDPNSQSDIANDLAEFSRTWPTKTNGDRSSREIEPFFERAIRLDTHGHNEFALDLIYDSVDQLLFNQAFSQLDAILAKIDVSVASTDLILAILTSTLPPKSRLPSRHSLLERFESQLKADGEFEEGLLVGLEG